MHPGLPQMGRITGAQRVDGRALRDAGGLARGAQGQRHAVARHGGRGDGHPQPAPAWCRKEPARMAVGGPVLRQHPERLRGQKHLAVPGPCATPPLEEPPGTVTIRDLEVCALLEAQPAGIEGREAGPRAEELQGGEHGAPLVRAEAHGALLLPWGADKGQRGPCPLQRLFVEAREAAPGDGTGRAGVVLDVCEVEEVVAQCLLRDPVRGLVVMVGQLTDGPDIHLLRAFREAAKLQIVDHPWTPWGHDDTACR